MLLSLDRLKKASVFMQHLRFDITPEVLNRPRFPGACEDVDKLVNETNGFSFYIDYFPGETPMLMIMKTYQLRSKTIGQVPEAPEDLLLAAVNKAGVKSAIGMYAIDDDVEAWLKTRLAK